MDIHVHHGPIQTTAADAIVVNLFQGVTHLGGATGAVDAALGGQISAVIGSGDFKGKLGETLVLYGRGVIPASRVIVVGLGKAEEFILDTVRCAAAAAALAARKLGARSLATIVHRARGDQLDLAAEAQARVEGTLLALYEFKIYKTQGDETPSQVEYLTVVETDSDRLEAISSGIVAGEAVAAGVILARDLANHPGNVATPTYLANQAVALAERHGMRVEVWDADRLRAERGGWFLGVRPASAEPPKFIIVEYAPTGDAVLSPHVLVGKGVPFDTGGISLKPGAKMGDMKFDMAGAAAVLGTMEAVGRLSLNRRIVGLIGATENMPGGKATKPGDIVRTLTGATVEIVNTDAEGRMVLADLLGFARRLQPAAVVDLATLTGAIVVALGSQYAGLFANDDALASALQVAGEATGEPLWRMPLGKRYDDIVKSKVADMANLAPGSPVPAGAVNGAKFLERFVQYPWAHLDIAATAWDAKDISYIPEGATGFGVRLLVQWLRA